MAVVVDRAPRLGRSLATVGALGWTAVGASAALGAGAIHASAIGTHAEHRQAMVAFTVVAALQLGWGALALARPGRLAILLGGLVNLVAVVGWLVAKTTGIAFIEGLDVKEPVQMADGLAAGLALVVVFAVAALLLRVDDRRLTAMPMLTGGIAVLLAATAVPGMLTAGTHLHEHGSDASHGGGATLVASAVAPDPYDPVMPIDLGGVEGVTPQEQARAENLVAITLLRLPRFADPAAVEAMGFTSIGDGFLGHEHYLSAANMNDDRILDPDYPESLVYDTSVTPKRLAAAMFMLNPGDTLADVPELGGALTQWHVHDNLCFAGSRVAGITDQAGNCGPGLEKGAQTPMIHVWIEPNPCGPFAALEGVAGGTIADGEERLCDHVHGG